jgi:DsbC/DsbD-like thiol-disulfide interchange protein
VRLTVDADWHIEAPPAPTAVRVSLAEDALGTLERIEFPEPETLGTEELSELSVYSGTVTIPAVLKLRANAPLGRRVLTIKVHFQACSSRICERPETILLSIPVEVVAP